MLGWKNKEQIHECGCIMDDYVTEYYGGTKSETIYKKYCWKHDPNQKINDIDELLNESNRKAIELYEKRLQAIETDLLEIKQMIDIPKNELNELIISLEEEREQTKNMLCKLSQLYHL